MMHTHPSVLPPSTAMVQTPLVLPEHTVVQATPLAAPEAQVGTVAAGM